VGGLGALVDRSISAADAIGKPADFIKASARSLYRYRRLLFRR
jgi:hypothetical protein